MKAGFSPSRLPISIFFLAVWLTFFWSDVQAAPARTLIRNASLIITMDPSGGRGELGVLEDADVLIEHGKIAAVGRHLGAVGAQVVDAAGMIVMPGFIDTHNHLWQSLIRGCGTDGDLYGWLDACVMPLFNPAIAPTHAEAYAGVRLSTLDLIDTGVTTVVEWCHAFTPEFVRGDIQALTDSGLRFVFAYRGRDNPASLADIRLVKKTLIDPNPKATFQVASHPSSAGRKDVSAMARLARELGVKHHVHLLENIVDRKEHMFDVLAEADALGPELLGAHGIHLTDREIGLLAAHDVRILHNPLSNMRLASGMIRLPELKRAGIQVGLGQDGGTNDTSDMFNTLRAAVGLQRARAHRPDVLRMATVDGAKLLGIFHRVGSLTPGKQADLILLNPESMNFSPRWDWASQIVFNGQPRNVEWVFVAGQALKKRGKLVGVDSSRIIEAAQNASAQLQRSIAKNRSASENKPVQSSLRPIDRGDLPLGASFKRQVQPD